MVEIGDRGNIKLTRGDTLFVPYFINTNTESHPIRYILQDGDVLYFALLELGQRFEDAIVKKVYTSESTRTEFKDIMLILNPEDTEYLLPGKYYYTLKLKYHALDGKEFIKTTTPEHEFWILD